MSVFIIAEIGINHNGDLGVAKELIHLAKDAGCDAVKFQKRAIDIVYTREFLDSPRKSPWGTTQRHQKEGLEFNYEQYKEIDSYCRELKIEWFASAWDIESQKFLREFDLKYNKVASAMIVYEDLLKEVASEGRYTFISTGGSSIETIEKAIGIFKQADCPFELMYCKGVYPMQDKDANMKCIETLRNHFNCKVGYSGHEVGLAISYAAAALGATSIERHITLSRAMYGSDQAASLEPAGLRMLVGSTRKIEQALGNGIIQILDDEISVMQKLRAHIPYEKLL